MKNGKIGVPDRSVFEVFRRALNLKQALLRIH